MSGTDEKRFANVYLIDKGYGGPEEGGWWYTFGQPIHSIECATEGLAQKVGEGLELWCAEENAKRNDNISSVMSEGRYTMCLEDHPAKGWPEERPYYE